MKNLLVLITLIVAFAACKPKQKQPFGRNMTLENRQWVLRELNGKAYTGGLVLEQKPGIHFDAKDNTWGANVGCNQINGMYTTQDDMIKLQQMAMTKMACPEEFRETEFVQMLDKTNRFSLTSKKIRKKDFYTLLLFADQVPVARLEMDTTGVW